MMIKLLLLYFFTSAVMGHDNIHKIHSPGGSSWQSSISASPTIGVARSASIWDNTAFDRPEWGKNGARTRSFGSNGFNANGFSGKGCRCSDDTNIYKSQDRYSTW